MRYIIGSIKRGNLDYLILKTISKEHTDLSGRITLEDRRGNTFVKDTFTVLRKYKSADSSDGDAYDWYYIKDHYREEDRSEEVRSQMEQSITDLEIESMEQDQAITDHDIAIMELQLALN